MRLALRSLAESPGFAAAVVATESLLEIEAVGEPEPPVIRHTR